MGLFGKRKVRTPQEAAQGAADAIRALRGSLDDRAHKKNAEEVEKCFASLKAHLFGDDEHETTLAAAGACASEVVRAGLPEALAESLESLDFEQRKDAAQIFGATVRMKETQGVEYMGERCVADKPHILGALLEGYRNSATAICCGGMLRDCLRHSELAGLAIQQPAFWDLFAHMENPAFEVASDAFGTFKDCLVKHPGAASAVLQPSIARFLSAYRGLLQSDNYVVKRQSLHLLGDLLGLPAYGGLALAFVNDLENLMLVMNLLRDPLRHISYEAFVVFKSFVVCFHSGKLEDPAVAEVLRRNRDKLLAFLGDFQRERDVEDEDFASERELILGIIRQVPEPQSPRASKEFAS